MQAQIELSVHVSDRAHHHIIPVSGPTCTAHQHPLPTTSQERINLFLHTRPRDGVDIQKRR